MAIKLALQTETIVVSEVTELNLLPDDFGLSPNIEVDLVLQTEDAWCYAACAEMIVTQCNKDQPTIQLVTQCEVASIAKESECCLIPAPVKCVDSGCRKDQVPDILKALRLDAVHAGPLSFSDVENEILNGDPLTARPPQPLLVIIDWTGEHGSHAVLVTGVLGQDMVYVVDPLPEEHHGGWTDFAKLEQGFGDGEWVETWYAFRKELP